MCLIGLGTDGVSVCKGVKPGGARSRWRPRKPPLPTSGKDATVTGSRTSTATRRVKLPGRRQAVVLPLHRQYPPVHAERHSNLKAVLARYSPRPVNTRTLALPHLASHSQSSAPALDATESALVGPTPPWPMVPPLGWQFRELFQRQARRRWVVAVSVRTCSGLMRSKTAGGLATRWQTAEGAMLSPRRKTAPGATSVELGFGLPSTPCRLPCVGWGRELPALDRLATCLSPRHKNLVLCIHSGMNPDTGL